MNGRTDALGRAYAGSQLQIQTYVNRRQPTLQPDLILLPSDAVHSWRGLSLQGVKAIPEQHYRQMVKQSSELHLLPFLCCPAHTRQPLGHAVPALCRRRVGLMSVLLDQRPSLLALRNGSSPSLFKRLIGIIPLSDSSKTCMRDVRLLPSPTGLSCGSLQASPRSPGSRA